MIPPINRQVSLPPLSSQTEHWSISQVELIVFDLDGTLLNQESAISDYTSDTLRLLAEYEIAYTVAKGRTLHGARAILEGHQFVLPQAYKNGVMIWHPEQSRFSSGAMLTADELDHIVRACIQQRVTPFVFTLEEDQQNIVYHPPLLSGVEQRLIHNLGIEDNISPRALDELSADAAITHVNAIGASEAIKSAATAVIGHHDDEGIARFLRERFGL